MDLRKAKMLLDKINALHKNISMDEDNIAEIEKDLMLSYVRQLYDCFISPSPGHSNSPPPKRIVKKIISEEKEVAPVVLPPKAPTKKVEVPKEPVSVERKIVEAPKVVEKASPSENRSKAAPPRKSSAELDVLFEHKEAIELSEKLSELPIKDLHKAMGLNEKIFTINELFDGDKTIYDETISALNGFRNFDDAKTFLSNHIAGKYKWVDKSKRKKSQGIYQIDQAKV